MTVTALEIATRAPILAGRPFGDAGPYEKIAGRLRFEVDPAHPQHRAITDLELAPRNAAGRVEFSADFYLLQPVRSSEGSRCWWTCPTAAARWRSACSTARRAPPIPPPRRTSATASSCAGATRWPGSGWQPDVPRQDGLMALDSPRARGAEGPVTGRLRCQWRPSAKVDTLPLADRYHIPYPAASLDDAEARADGARARRRAAPAGAARGVALRPPGGRRARVAGCLASASPRRLRAGRDLRAHLSLAGSDPGRASVCWPCAMWAPGCASAPRRREIPARARLDRAYAFGVSQTGRFLRHFLYLGLNEDESGRQVYDAVFPHVAGGRRGEFNMRFGQPSLNATQSVGSLFPFTDSEQVGSGDRTARRAAVAPGRRRQDAEDLHREYLGRVLARGRVARAHRRRGPRRRGAARPCPDLSLRGHPAHARARCRRRRRIPIPATAAAPRSIPWTTRRCSAPPSSTSIAGSPTGPRRRPARCRAWPTAPRWPRSRRPLTFARIPGRALPRSPQPARAARLGLRLGARHRLEPAAQGGPGLCELCLGGGRGRQRGGGHPAAGAAGAAGHLYGLESPASRPRAHPATS